MIDFKRSDKSIVGFGNGVIIIASDSITGKVLAYLSQDGNNELIFYFPCVISMAKIKQIYEDLNDVMAIESFKHIA